MDSNNHALRNHRYLLAILSVSTRYLTLFLLLEIVCLTGQLTD